jgi:2'-5' RNA ligase
VARLFVAVWPSAEVEAELRSLPRKDQAGVRFLAPETWHVTLRFLGEADPAEVAAALGAAAAAGDLPSAALRYGPAVDLLGERQLVVPVHGADDLAAAVASATAHLGEPPPRRRFAGHLTVARMKPRKVPGFRMPAALGAAVVAEQQAEQVALVESRLHPEGPEYTTLEAWPTSAR